MIVHDVSFVHYSFTLDSLTFNNNVKKACLPRDCNDCSPGMAGHIAGWGDTSEGGSAATVLQHASVPIATSTTCSNQYGSGYASYIMICAGGNGIDTCQGDSGGPFLTLPSRTNRYTLCGVTSWGHGCARPQYYGVYSKVCAALDWIRSNTGIN